MRSVLKNCRLDSRGGCRYLDSVVVPGIARARRPRHIGWLLPGSSPPGSLTTARPGANLGALSNVGMDAARRTCRSFFPWVRAEAGGDGDEGGAAIITGSDRGRERACSGRSGIRWR